MAVRIYFLRHGRPENEECLRGIEDFALTQEGFEQMAKSYGHIEDKLDWQRGSESDGGAVSVAEVEVISVELLLFISQWWWRRGWGWWW